MSAFLGKDPLSSGKESTAIRYQTGSTARPRPAAPSVLRSQIHFRFECRPQRRKRRSSKLAFYLKTWERQNVTWAQIRHHLLATIRDRSAVCTDWSRPVMPFPDPSSLKRSDYGNKMVHRSCLLGLTLMTGYSQSCKSRILWHCIRLSWQLQQPLRVSCQDSTYWRSSQWLTA
ncbi:hypothetical protein BC830DRAFT_371534 [Chytriomyces sp. MP71]|nr:hypothetical protein BC830DRAFT_371534 [Chytriomyces sp. MP71]